MNQRHENMFTFNPDGSNQVVLVYLHFDNEIPKEQKNVRVQDRRYPISFTELPTLYPF